ncbi:unnamed protein product [Brassica napus]|uniref:C2 domain-containing protein n=2 Tax=Brassica TaxID=3705 RepID=A0A3P6D148_BRAOL|nr:unnamed protein product [Brassica napus]VDD13299.1 unnamed protein product [Brassica oleracea]
MAAKKDDFSVKKISPKLGGERGIRNPNGPTSSHDLVEQMEFLYVEWNQVFAFDKTKGDVLSVTLKDGRRENGTVIGKQNFKVAADIPFRVPPDARIASQWYSMTNMELMMSVWFGTQADEVYPRAWFSDASDVSASCVSNTRPKLYLAPRLCHDLICNDVKRTPSVYVRATLGDVELYTEVSLGSNPSWNQDLIFVASEPLDETVYITLFDKVNGQPHDDECIRLLEKKLSEMTAVKVPGSAPALFYDIEPPVKVEPAGDSRRFSSRIKMKLATDQAYHVFDECIQYSSDYRAFAKGLWPDLLGKLEIGILGATGLQPMKEWRDGRRSTDAYVVAKYGKKWARTRTVVGSFSPKWNEQYSWDVYDKCTTVTFGIFDNNQLAVYFSMRITNANLERLLVVFGWWYWILCLAVWPVVPVYLAVISLLEIFRLSRREFNRLVLGVDARPPPPLVPLDLKLWGLDSPDLDELAEEFDTFPSSVVDVNVLRMRYDRLRREMGENVMLLLGDVASQCERLCALLSLLDSPLAWICFSLGCYAMVVLVYVFWDHVIFFQKFLFICFVVRWVNFQCFRNDLPGGISNFFRRLPTNEGPMF